MASGKIITFDEIVTIPPRTKYLDQVAVKVARAALAARSAVEFLPVHIWERYLPERAGAVTLDKYGKRMYKICMSGILKSGENAMVILDGITPYFELRVPRHSAAEGSAEWRAATTRFLDDVRQTCVDQRVDVYEYKTVAGATVREYADRADFIQLHFTNLSERSKALKYFTTARYKNSAYETTHDDATCYYRLVSRDTRTAWTSWCTLTDYRVTKAQEHPFFVDMVINVNYGAIAAYSGDIFADQLLREDRTIACLWDIETCDPKSDEIPKPNSSTFDIPNIGMSFAFIDAEITPINGMAPAAPEYNWTMPRGHIVQFNITTLLTAAMPNRTTVICRDIGEMIMAFGLIWRQMRPNYVCDFNGHCYDWWCVVETARRLGLLEFLERNMSVEKIASYRSFEASQFRAPQAFADPSVDGGVTKWSAGYEYWHKYQFKIAADLPNYSAACLNYPGYVCIDLLPQLRAMCGNPEKYSLHKFLGMFQLGDKVEMPYKEMFARFAGNRRLLCELAPADLRMDTVMAAAHAHSGRTVYKTYKLGREVYIAGDTLYAYNMRYPMSSVVVRQNLADICYPTMLEAVTAAMQDALEVAEYCVVDGLRCHDLLSTTQFIRDKRQIGVLSFTTMDDCTYRANGMKVRQMIIAKAAARGYHVSNRAPEHVEMGKYPGAYVFPPQKGVAAARPSLAELRDKPGWRDMTDDAFNKCLERVALSGIWLELYLPAARELPQAYPDRAIWSKIVTARYPTMKYHHETETDFAVRYEAATMQAWQRLYKNRAIDFATFEGDLAGDVPEIFVAWLLADSHYPIAGLDFSSLYPSLIMTYNFSPEMMVHSVERALELQAQGKKIHRVEFQFNGRTIKGWSVRSRYPASQVEIAAAIKRDDAVALEQLLVSAEFGLFPTVLKDLFDQRVALKAQLKPLTHRIEEFKLMPSARFAECQEEYSITMGRWNYLNSKQKALKVFMNTFYGESGNARSPLRVLALAGGVTTSGQYNIKKVARLVQDLGCRIYYGDSVTGDTPVLLRCNDTLRMTTFYDIQTWHATQTEKELSEEWNSCEIWTAGGWRRIRSVVRHCTSKRIYRVQTVTGLIDVTEDHSLLDAAGHEIKPEMCRVGDTKLLHGSPVSLSNTFDNIEIAIDVMAMTDLECLAYIMGYDYCCFLSCENGADLLDKMKTKAAKYAPNKEWRFVQSHVDQVFQWPLKLKRYFITGVINSQRGICIYDKVIVTSQIEAATLSYVIRELGFSCRVESITIAELYTLVIEPIAVVDHAIQSISIVPIMTKPERWVYDITTDNGTFGAGIGEIIVHNTDSVYISMPGESFAEADRAYYSIPYSEFSAESKVAYYEAVVTESFRQISVINRAVNDALEADNGTRFLAMAFEEFLYPSAFFSKKKYCGIAHEGVFNPNPKDIFVRGLEYVKKGVSDMLRDLSKEILWETFSPTNIDPIDVIVERMIERIYTHKNIDYKKFIMTASYKPNKKNQKVHTFHTRMSALGLAPEPYDRFSYVMVKKYPYNYDLCGRKKELSVGERMEYVDRAQNMNMEIDLDYYMGASVCGQLARFISWRRDFNVEPTADTDEAYTESEKKNIALAAKYVERCYERWSTKHTSKGPALRVLYKRVNTAFQTEFRQILPVGDVWSIDNCENLYQQLVKRIDAAAVASAKREVEKIISRMTINNLVEDIAKRDLYKQILADRRTLITSRVTPLLRDLNEYVGQLQLLFSKRDGILENAIANLTVAVGISDNNFGALGPIIDRINSMNMASVRNVVAGDIMRLMSQADIKLLNTIDMLYVQLYNLQRVLHTTEGVVNQLNAYIQSKLGAAPVRAELDDIDAWMSDNL